MAGEDDGERLSPEELAAIDAESRLIDTGQERQHLEERRKKIREDDDSAARFWREVFADPIGRREMWAILADSHALETDRFATGPVGFPQDMASWHWAGARDLGLRLFRGWMRLDPDGVLKMIQEHDPAFKTAPQPRRRARRVRAGQ